MSRPGEDRVTVDAGQRRWRLTRGPRRSRRARRIRQEWASDEPRQLGISGATNHQSARARRQDSPGSLPRDPIFNPYDWRICARGHRVEQVLPNTVRERFTDARRPPPGSGPARYLDPMWRARVEICHLPLDTSSSTRS
jgi:hypothetical protein